MLKWLVLPMVVLAYLAATVSAGAPRDRDHDRLPDRWERKHELSTTTPSAKTDPDRDRLDNRRELRLRTHPRRADTDRDRLRDGAEVRRFHTNPRKRDTDGDGFRDRCELRKGTNPRKRRSHPKRRCSKSPQGQQAPPRHRALAPPRADADGDRVANEDDLCPTTHGVAPDGCSGRFVSGGGGDSASFHADCNYSHSAPDDPIVAPGQPGASHMHDFIGARGLNAFSTNESIRVEANNCVRTNTTDSDADKSAYWAPSLIVNGDVVRPDSGSYHSDASAYYKISLKRPGNIQPFPAHFRVIAGIASGGPRIVNGTPVYEWSCPDGVAQAGTSSTLPLCNTARLQLMMTFPDCSDGRSDSPNHRDHAAYASFVPGTRTRACPSSHPIELPQLALEIKYPTRGGSTARLSTVQTGASGNATTSHADFMNGWDQTRLESLVDGCLNINRYCGGQDKPVPGHP